MFYKASYVKINNVVFRLVGYVDGTERWTLSLWLIVLQNLELIIAFVHVRKKADNLFRVSFIYRGINPIT